MIHAYASQPQYWRHLAPIVEELRARGHEVSTWAYRGSQPWGAQAQGFPQGAVVLVASWVDARRLNGCRAVYVEHGAGQTYVEGPPEGYAGSGRLDHVVLFLTPGEHVARRWRERYPQAAVEIVGCPALDQHLHAYASRDVRTRVAPRVVISSHWWCGVVPETMPTLFRFERGILDLARLGTVELVGHAHPRAARRTRALWDRLGIQFEVDPDIVLATADLLVHDNSSLMYEAAALGIPVLALNAPTYRRDVEHGLRFWSHVPGLQCDEPKDFASSCVEALEDPPEAKALRVRAATHVYAHRDGRASDRAATAIEEAIAR